MKLRHILALPILWLVLVGQSDARPQTNPLTGNNLSIVTAEITSKAHEFVGESVVDPEGYAPKVTIDIRPNDDRYKGTPRCIRVQTESGSIYRRSGRPCAVDQPHVQQRKNLELLPGVQREGVARVGCDLLDA